jgi:hypothetical protein
MVYTKSGVVQLEFRHKQLNRKIRIMSFDVNILVNGSRCKQYRHQGKTFVQANPGSEYVIEIKNNHWKRILAVGSVDGLNVLTGNTAKEGDTGYIVGAYSTEKVKGFRISDSEWALFKFGYKFNGKTYAQSKNDGSEKNCGVIGLRFFYEQEPIVINTPSSPWPNWGTYSISASYCLNGGLYGPGRYGYENSPNYTTNVNYMSNTLGQQDLRCYTSNCGVKGQSVGFVDTAQPLMDMSSEHERSYTKGGLSADCCVAAACAPTSPVPNFDMGTCWGKTEQSKVQNVEFERGCLAESFDIYYASRESLIEMGVPIHNTLSVNLPQSFPTQYCTPPPGYNG